jgi:hypothetical protein
MCRSNLLAYWDVHIRLDCKTRNTVDCTSNWPHCSYQRLNILYARETDVSQGIHEWCICDLHGFLLIHRRLVSIIRLV